MLDSVRFAADRALKANAGSLYRQPIPDETVQLNEEAEKVLSAWHKAVQKRSPSSKEISALAQLVDLPPELIRKWFDRALLIGVIEEDSASVSEPLSTGSGATYSAEASTHFTRTSADWIPGWRATDEFPESSLNGRDIHTFTGLNDSEDSYAPDFSLRLELNELPAYDGKVTKKPSQPSSKAPKFKLWKGDRMRPYSNSEPTSPTQHPEISGGYLCKECNRTFNRARDLKRHSSVHMPKERTIMHHCPECTQVFRHPKDLRRHCHVHDIKRPFKCPIVACNFATDGSNKGFKRLDHLERHLTSSHDWAKDAAREVVKGFYPAVDPRYPSYPGIEVWDSKCT